MHKSVVNGKPGKGQEESHLKVLRELSHITGNRYCFDCGQRGPTYVNITIGSFICMSCSGLLRGLTPPHRVKSISMASFTPDEIELLKSRGNDYCKKVWLATCTSRDSHIGSEKDPDRVNALKTFMSAKYEQKRYYVDPSKLPQSELNEIQAQTAKALSSSSSSISNSSGSTMQKSPSLSSASSASSLSLHNQNNPSPVLNNSRNSRINSQNRLVNSITLPDIKPLTSLLGPVNVSSNSANHTNGSKTNNLAAGSLGLANGKPTSTPVPINFINNLTSTQSQNQNKPSGLVNGTSMFNNDPWEGDNNNFNANFADFDAFNSNSKNGGGNDVNDLNTGNFANFDAFQQPLLPANNSTVMDLNSVKNVPTLPPGGQSQEDKYAALKDLDNIFKTGFNGEATSNNAISSSVSFPANLSSSAGAGASGLTGGWFSSSPNQQQGGNSSSGTANGGWNVSGNGSTHNGPNPHNPFFNNVAASPWQSPPSVTSNSIFSTSPGAFQTHQSAGLSQQMSNGFSNGTTNGLFSSSSSNGGFLAQTQPSASFNKANPFFSTMPSTSVNPNNPFL